LLLYGRRVDAQRRLPRCGILLRPFVLRPLADLAPDATHPLTGERFGAVWKTRSSIEAAPMSVEPPTR
jgi:2-amino-4-hydroxy-6-hydroxymethyldihydropteridine diphosphokinase